MRMLTLLVLGLLVSTPVLADSITTDFEGGANDGNWTFNGNTQGVVPEGGNPGGWFSVSDMWTYAPVLRSGTDAVGFTGDYVALGVSSLSGDFSTPYCMNSGADYMNFTVVLRNNMGTPGDMDDDVYVYPDPLVNTIPPVGAGWTHYTFDIPSDFVGAEGELPAGWLGGSYRTGADVFPSDITFAAVLSGVSDVEFHWIHPAYYALISLWEAGADNITIEFGDGPVATESASLDGVKALYR